MNVGQYSLALLNVKYCNEFKLFALPDVEIWNTAKKEMPVEFVNREKRDDFLKMSDFFYIRYTFKTLQKT